LTREAEDNRELRRELEGRGLRVLERPCISTEVRGFDGAAAEAGIGPDGLAVLAFTSRRGVLAFAPAPQLLRGFSGRIAVVGGATAKAVEAIAGRKPDIVASQGGAASLARAIVSAAPPGRVLHVCGNRAGADLGERLGEAGFDVERLVVYETTTCVPEAVEEPAVVVFASPSAVEAFFAVNPAEGCFSCVAIGKTTEKSLREAGAAAVFRSAGTDTEALVEAVMAAEGGGERSSLNG
jgi:uroporphyrinogen-III synthase